MEKGAALDTDTTRQSESIKATFAAGIERQQPDLGNENNGEGGKRADLIDTIVHLVGALVLSRAGLDDSSLADDILETCHTRILNQEIHED